MDKGASHQFQSRNQEKYKLNKAAHTEVEIKGNIF